MALEASEHDELLKQLRDPREPSDPAVRADPARRCRERRYPRAADSGSRDNDAVVRKLAIGACSKRIGGQSTPPPSSNGFADDDEDVQSAAASGALRDFRDACDRGDALIARE